MLIAPLAHGTLDYAYIIIRASTADENMRQPHWILMNRVGLRRDMNFPAKGPIVRVKAGNYKIHHIGFSKSIFLSGSSFQLADPIELQVEAGNIYIFGNLKLHKVSFTRDTKYSIDIDIELLKDACEDNPDIFKTLPTINIHTGDKFMLSCVAE